MRFTICEKRQAFIDEAGHCLVLGGPGSGKTTVALLKAQKFMRCLKPGQKILFLSFSRAAVQQVLTRCKEVMKGHERELIDVRTYHSFCWDLLRCHGRLLGGNDLHIMTPGQEGVRRTRFEGDWTAERRRILEEDGRVCFDLFAATAARLVEESRHMRERIADLHPLVILDEFQDTDDDQWKFVGALASAGAAVFLGDGDQRIYDWRPGVRPERLDLLRAALKPVETDLSADNHRSGGADILDFANVVLRGRGPMPATRDVKSQSYKPFPNMFNSTVHFAVGNIFGELRRLGIADPTVAVLASSNALVADISGILSTSHTFGSRPLSPISHDVVWDAELSAAAAVTVAAALELASKPCNQAKCGLLEAAAQYWLIKKDWLEQYSSPGERAYGAATADTRAKRFLEGSDSIQSGKTLRKGVTTTLCDAVSGLGPLQGEPVNDWRKALQVFQLHKDLKDIFSQARLIRIFRVGDALATLLADLWMRQGQYSGAVLSVRRVLDQERLVGAEREPRGCVLMTLHKSKGKEFDGVVIVEGYNGGTLFKPAEKPLYEPSRRLLRVGITRARKLVTIVRPTGARPLVD